MTAEQPHDVGYEGRDVSVRHLALVALVVVIIVVVVIAFVTDYYISVREKLVEEVVLSPKAIELRELRSREEEELTGYKLLDSAAEIYRIPIERAVQLVADEAYREQTTK